MNKQGYNKMSLSEQVNEVRESSMSKVDKCKALIKLGFTPYEIEFVLRDSVANSLLPLVSRLSA